MLFVYILSCCSFSGISNRKLSSFIFILSPFLISVFKTFPRQYCIGSIPKVLLYNIFGIDPTVTERVIFKCHIILVFLLIFAMILFIFALCILKFYYYAHKYLDLLYEANIYQQIMASQVALSLKSTNYLKNYYQFFTNSSKK